LVRIFSKVPSFFTGRHGPPPQEALEPRVSSHFIKGVII
jgi:hypothetical protein